MKTYSAKLADIQRNWHVIDADGVVVGRMASKIAMLLMGKHKPMYSPNLDCGDHVVVINADKAKFTGAKRNDKRYYRHTGFPGGIKETSPEKLNAAQKSNRIIEAAVKRMLPKGALGVQQLTKLRVYEGAEHPHTAQQPKVLDFAAQNPKNKRNNSR
jgi:large subunit ribosomal protein L13